MRKQNLFVAYLLIGIGIYFLLRQLHIPIFSNFYSWPTILMIIGIAFLLQSRSSRDDQNLFNGTFLLGLGIHFHGSAHYSFWINHWAIYTLIIGIAFFVRYLKTKNGWLQSLIFIGGSLFLIFSANVPVWFPWIYQVTDTLERFWPVALIVLGLYLLRKKWLFVKWCW